MIQPESVQSDAKATPHRIQPDKPYAPACDENRDPILGVLRPRLQMARSVLEIGSGTGQHAVYFAKALPQLTWQTSDVPMHLPGIRLWLTEASLPNLPPPLELDVAAVWPAGPYDAVFSANTAHIMSEARVLDLLHGVSHLLSENGLLIWYGPFNRDGQFTSESNQRFDAMLRAQDPAMGIRDLTWLETQAHPLGLILDECLSMPVNNFTTIWRRASR